MKNIKYSIISLLLVCVVSMCGESKTNIKNPPMDTWEARENAKKIRLRELRAKAKELFPDLMEYGQITPKHFEKDGTSNTFILHIAGIIYESGGKMIRIPIFRGGKGDVLYQDFLEYCRANGMLGTGFIETAFTVRCKEGEFAQVLDELKKFYSRNLSIDFEKPFDRIPYADWEQTDVFKFILDGVTGELSYTYLYEEHQSGATFLDYSIRIKQN